MTQVGDVRLEMPPLAGRVAHPEHELPGKAGALRFGEHLPVVLMDELLEPVLQQLGLRMSDQPRHRTARVPAAAVAQHQHEVGRRRDEAPEVRSLAPGRRDQCPGEQQ